MDTASSGVAALKTCGRCKQEKPVDEFYRDRAKPDGRRHMCRTCCAEKFQELKQKRGKQCDGCGVLVSPYRSRCQKCKQRGERSFRWRGGRSIDRKGYVVLSGYQDHPNARVGGSIPEHVLVMSQHLGRPLLPGETVHHKNGVRDDNRVQNLELWSTSQPSGQRVEDKIAWAREFLAQYGYEVSDAPEQVQRAIE